MGYNKWTDGANDGQKEAILRTEGNSLVLAGAGAGKTRVMVSRCGNLIDTGVSPTEILMITFTNKAASEMSDRIVNMIGEVGEHVTVGTFHSVFLQHILKTYASSNPDFLKSIQLKEDFSIADSDESAAALKHVFKNELTEEQLEFCEDNDITAPRTMRRISLARADGHNLKSYKVYINKMLDHYRAASKTNSKALEQLEEKEKMFNLLFEIWEKYNHHLRVILNSIDFDDILCVTKDLLEFDPTIVKLLGSRYRHIMVDEFQDTNGVQWAILKKIAKVNNNMMAVGDRRQSIYGFRGANIIIIENYREEMDADLIELPINYRSTETVVSIANLCASMMAKKISDNGMIAANTNSCTKAGWLACDDDRLEAKAIVKSIQTSLDQFPNESIAVLYRSRTLKTELEQELINQGVPHEMVGDTQFFDRKEVKDVISLARFFLFPHDRPAGLRFIDSSGGLGLSGAGAREAIANANGELSVIGLMEDRAAKSGKNGDRARALLSAITFVMRAHSGSVHPQDLYDDLFAFWERYQRPGLERYAKNQVQGENEEAGKGNLENRLTNVEIVLKRIRDELLEGRSLDMIFEDLMLLVENGNLAALTQNQNTVKLMTIHASKGLEFNRVYIIGNDVDKEFDIEDLTEDELEEERRISYVAMTRAESHLIFTSAKKRRVYGKIQPRKLSPHIKDIQSQLIKRVVDYRGKPNSATNKKSYNNQQYSN